MITFDTTLDAAVLAILSWDQKNRLTCVRMIRDVFGRITVLLDNTESVPDENLKALEALLKEKLKQYYSGKLYCKKMPSSKKRESDRMQPIIQLLEESGREWKTVDDIVFYVSERTIAKKAWINNVADNEPVWPYEDAVDGNAPKVVTFYSFKGGMGRTTTLAGVALSLCQRGYHVLMVDTDIEAPGLASLFLDEEAVHKGVLDYLVEEAIETRDISDYVIDIAEPSLLDADDGNLYLFPAGKVDANYLQKLARIDYQDHRPNHLKNALTKMLCRIKDKYAVDYILIDARAGFHDMGGITVSQLPHGSVLIGNNTRQSWEGMTQVLRTIAEGHDDDLPILLIDSMCEKPISLNYADMKKDFESKAYTACIENYYTVGSVLPGPEAEGVAHAPEFIPFKDELLQGVTLYSSGDPQQDARVREYKEILTDKTYKAITDRVANWFGGY